MSWVLCRWMASTKKLLTVAEWLSESSVFHLVKVNFIIRLKRMCVGDYFSGRKMMKRIIRSELSHNWQHKKRMTLRG